jgi:sec-independent protein translocase protein TatB
MFEIAWSELLLVLVVAIIFVGPKELPGMLRTFGRMMGKLRRAADDFRQQFDESVREAGGEDLQRELAELRRNNPLNEIRNTIEDAARQVEAEPKPRLPAPEPSIDNPAEQPAVHETMTPPDTAAPPAASPAQTDAAPPSPEPAAPAKEAGAPSPGHEPRVNGQHRPLS